MTTVSRPPVSRAAYLLGYAGLLPQVAAVLLLLVSRRDGSDLAWIPAVFGYALTLIYGGVILSFLGGIWWGIAIRRSDGQGMLAFVAVLPSLAAVTVLVWATLNSLNGPRFAHGPLFTLGAAIMLTLVVDRHLISTGEAPPDWMRLRVPLSLGLGGLTILAGLLFP